MTFDPELIAAVRARAPQGVHFTDEEVVRALNAVAQSQLFIGVTLVERCAITELRVRRDRAARVEACVEMAARIRQREMACREPVGFWTAMWRKFFRLPA